MATHVEWSSVASAHTCIACQNITPTLISASGAAVATCVGGGVLACLRPLDELCAEQLVLHILAVRTTERPWGPVDATNQPEVLAALSGGIAHI